MSEYGLSISGIALIQIFQFGVFITLGECK